MLKHLHWILYALGGLCFLIGTYLSWPSWKAWWSLIYSIPASAWTFYAAFVILLALALLRMGMQDIAKMKRPSWSIRTHENT